MADKIEPALSKKTKAIFSSYSWESFDLNRVIDIAQKHNLWVIEDACDALGSKYNGSIQELLGILLLLVFILLTISPWVKAGLWLLAVTN